MLIIEERDKPVFPSKTTCWILTLERAAGSVLSSGSGMQRANANPEDSIQFN